MKVIKVLGIGPGHPDYCLPIVKKQMNACQVLVGGKRQLALRDPDVLQELIPFSMPLDQMMEKIKTAAECKEVGILVSGDSGYYSLLTALKRWFKPEDLEVYPGISSLQYLFSRLAIPWDRAELGSLHGRDWDWLTPVEDRKVVGLLTDAKKSPDWIANRLVEAGLADCWMAIGENLSYSEERIEICKPEQVKDKKFGSLSVVVIGYD